MKQKSVMGDFATVFGYYLKKEMRSKVYLIVTVLLLRVKGGVSYRALPGVPVRPKPVATSSATSNTSRSRQRCWMC